MSARPTTLGFGKCDAPLKTLVPEEVKEDFLREARRRGFISESDALRELVVVFVYGADHLLKIHAERIKSLTGIGPESVR